MRQVQCARCGQTSQVEQNDAAFCPHCGAPLFATAPQQPIPAADNTQPGQIAAYPQVPTTPATSGQMPGQIPPMPPGMTAPYMPHMPQPGMPGAYPMPYGYPPQMGYPPAQAQPGQYPYPYPPAQSGQHPYPAYPPQYPYPYPYGYPAQPAPGTVPLPGAGQPPLVIQQATEVARQRQRRRRWLLIGGGILAAVLVLGVVGLVLSQINASHSASVSTPTPLPTVQAPAGFSVFRDPDGVFALGLPSEWEQVASKSTDVSMAQFGAKSQSATLSIQYTDNFTATELQNSEAMLTTLPGSVRDGVLSNKSQPSNVSLAGESWSQVSADLQYSGDSGPVTMHVVALTATHNATLSASDSVQYLVSILYMAPASTFDSLNAKDFQPALNSFIFEK